MNFTEEDIRRIVREELAHEKRKPRTVNPIVQERHAEWHRLVTVDGKSFDDVAKAFGCTRQAVDLALRKKFGYVSPRAHNPDERARLRAIEKENKRVNRFSRTVGLCVSEFERLTGVRFSHKADEVLRFREFRNNAIQQGNAFSLTWRQWWDIWSASGHWEHRGRGYGYCMSRHDTSKPFEAGNVKIEAGAERASRNTFGHQELRA